MKESSGKSRPALQGAKRFGKGRLEAFSDGVFAIIITIMVLELKVPHGSDLATLLKLGPTFFAYVLSFVYVGIYWNNHHHLLHAAKHIDGRVMWANLHLLFWLSLFPFMTGFVAENHLAPLTVVVYACVLFMAAVAYTILVIALRTGHPENAAIHRAIGGDLKGKVSLIAYVTGGAVGYFQPWAGLACFVAVACMWLVPDRRIERALHEEESAKQ